MNVETLYDASSFKSAISYDLVENFPAFNNFEKDTSGLFSKPTKDEELKLNNYSISTTTNSKEAREKVVDFLIFFVFLNKFISIYSFFYIDVGSSLL